VSSKTNYPFSDKLEYEIQSSTPFEFYVRIPNWVNTDKATIRVGYGRKERISPSNGLQCIKVKSGTTKVNIQLPMTISTVTPNGTVGVYNGPLLYAADIKYAETSHQPLNWTDRLPLPGNEVDLRSRDYILEPTSNWRFAIDPATIKVKQDGTTHKLPNRVFTRDSVPVSLQVDAYPIGCLIEIDTAGLPPIDPVVDKSQKVMLKLIPFGAAKLHIAQFPVAKYE
jgi:hypothetical protein